MKEETDLVAKGTRSDVHKERIRVVVKKGERKAFTPVK